MNTSSNNDQSQSYTLEVTTLPPNTPKEYLRRANIVDDSTGECVATITPVSIIFSDKNHSRNQKFAMNVRLVALPDSETDMADEKLTSLSYKNFSMLHNAISRADLPKILRHAMLKACTELYKYPMDTVNDRGRS